MSVIKKAIIDALKGGNRDVKKILAEALQAAGLEAVSGVRIVIRKVTRRVNLIGTEEQWEYIAKLMVAYGRGEISLEEFRQAILDLWENNMEAAEDFYDKLREKRIREGRGLRYIRGHLFWRGPFRDIFPWMPEGQDPFDLTPWMKDPIKREL